MSQSEPSSEMLSRACPLCGSHDESHVYAEAHFDPQLYDSFAFASRKLPEYMHYRLVCCPQCDVLYASPLPSQEMLARAYREADFGSSLESRYAAQTYGRLLRRVRPHLSDHVGALDIGAGDGTFLRQLLDHGFQDVVGVEPSTAPIAAAEERVRPLLRQGLFRREDFAAERFSLISCFQTIEHVYDPGCLCRDVFALLKKGGAILLVMHNRRAFSAKVLGKRSPIFDIEHLQLFSPASARYLLESAGFRRVAVRAVFNRYPLNYWLKLFPLPKAAKQRLIGALDVLRIGRLPIALPAGNLMAVGYKEPA
jgi:SAM-dependent methyltransferase